MARIKRGRGQSTLFSVDSAQHLPQRLDELNWPDPERFPLNRGGAHVRDVIVPDILTSKSLLVVAGYSSIGELVDALSLWDAAESEGASARLLFGTEPSSPTAKSFTSPRLSFTKETSNYWLQHGVSLLLSAKVLRVIELVENHVVRARFLAGSSPLHGKIYVGDRAATVGSSNFTKNGLTYQMEGNARFDKGDSDPTRFKELAQIAENYWNVGEDWNEEFLSLLRLLLRLVTWQEALARACAELLEGDWADRYLRIGTPAVQALWPSQRSGIAQALFIIENVGSVLVADATGSGKTRMGAHLVRAVRDRLWSTGRVRQDITALVCPPAVLDTWRVEGVNSGVQLAPVSHGILSRSIQDPPSVDHRIVREAQLLAVDEAHNFLNSGSRRTLTLRENLADHVMLFTATPISRGSGDLLNLVALLGPDNFEDSTLEVLNRLERLGGLAASSMTPDEIGALRAEIARFTLRRTKGQINRLVDRSPESYRHAETGRTCRYPVHLSQVYDTAESDADQVAADRIRAITNELSGIALLPRSIEIPTWARLKTNDGQWLQFRLLSEAGLAQHQVLNTLRSSSAALHKHLLGTTSAMNQFGIEASFKTTRTRGMLSKLNRLAGEGPPDVSSLLCETPAWLTDPALWSDVCRAESNLYRAIAQLIAGVSNARELGKRDLLLQLAERHERVLAFDHHLVTLAVMEQLLDCAKVPVLMATGQNKQQRNRVARLFAPTATGHAIALCSDAMNEGLNLQGASVMVHLDLPTTLRVAEQRVGCVDRMDSRYDSIEACWPRDTGAFATRANEKLVRRLEESESLLGANLNIPNLQRGSHDEEIVSVESQIQEFESTEYAEWDGIHDALEPVRRLLDGSEALISQSTYEQYREVAARVMCYVTALRSAEPWAFLSVRATARGAPRWMLVEKQRSPECEVDIRQITDRLRQLLVDDPPSRPLDAEAMVWLDHALLRAALAERRMIPRRMLRALDQMNEVVRRWADQAGRIGNWDLEGRWSRIASVAEPGQVESGADPYAVAERWLTLVAPVLEEHRRTQDRHARYTLLRDINPRVTRESIRHRSDGNSFLGCTCCRAAGGASVSVHHWQPVVSGLARIAIWLIK